MSLDDNQNIIPLPGKISRKTGNWRLEEGSRIGCRGGDSVKDIGELLAKYLRPATGYALPVVEAEGCDIQLHQTDEDVLDGAGFMDEEYGIDVEDSGLFLRAATSAGLARGVQVLRQLFPTEIFSDTVATDVDWVLPCVSIESRPRFRWRGLHLDVSRHFFGVDAVCRYIDLLAMHGFNVFHWHLTDDQGWRIEIKKHPRLTDVGSQRPYTLVGHESARPRHYDDESYGGFYSQEEVRRIVQYAAKRRVNIVPEIDMPGHMQAAIAAYPELGNTAMTLTPRCHWGISQHILNPQPSTVRFMQEVLEEVTDLFGWRFIHVGGDEAVKVEWSESRGAQERMSELKLASEAQMQSWFISQMDQFLTERGRRLIGWDEILQGGLAPGAAVMSWRGIDGGIEAARQGHDVVMCPNNSTYFDHYQAEPVEEEPLAIGGLTALRDVYEYEPIPDEMTDAEASHVLGSQGQLWTEYIENLEKLEYMAYPRACALAEVTWTESSRKSWGDFQSRLDVHRERLDRLH